MNVINTLKKIFRKRDYFTDEQFDEIIKGVKYKINVNLYADPSIPAEIMRELRLAIKDPKTELFAYNVVNKAYKEGFDKDQLHEIRLGIKDNVNVSSYYNTSIPAGKMEQMRLGLKNDIDITKFVNIDEFSASQLTEIRLGLLSEIDINGYADSKIKSDKMREYRNALEEEIDISSYPYNKYPAQILHLIWVTKKYNKNSIEKIENILKIFR